MFVNAITFDVDSISTISDEKLALLERYFYNTQVELANIQQRISREIRSIPDWEENQHFTNILRGLGGTSARKNPFLPMFGVCGDKEDYLTLWRTCCAERKAREIARRDREFLAKGATRIWTVISIEEDYDHDRWSSRVEVTTRVVGVFTSLEAAQEAAVYAPGEVDIIRGHLNSTQEFDDPECRSYGHSE